MTKKWIGGTKCNFCGDEVTKYEYFVDAVTKQGPWALMCPACYKLHGVPLGQKYGPNKEKICNLKKK